MTAKLVTRWNAAAAAIICVFATLAVAQRTLDTEQPQSSGASRDATVESESRQSGRAAATQSERSSAQRQDRSGQRYTANFRGEAAAAGGANQEVEKFIANCLLTKNQAEVELSQLAAQRAQNPQVKEFAQQMVKEHQQLIQQLKPLAGMQTGATERTSRTVVGATEDPSRVRTGDEAADAQAPGAATTTRTEARTAAGSPNAAISQLIQIDRQIVDRQTEAVRSELDQKQGAEFDKAFVGCAIGAHMHMNAALEVIGQQGEGKLSQIAQQAQPTVQQHLDHAKQLMQDLEQGAATGSRAARQPSQTQRE